MASPYGPAFASPGFAAAAHGTPHTGGRYADDFSRERASGYRTEYSGHGYNDRAHTHNEYDRDLRTSAAPDFAPLLFGAGAASPGIHASPSQNHRSDRYGHEAGYSGNDRGYGGGHSTLQTPAGSQRGRGFFGGAAGRDGNAATPHTGGKRIFGGGVVSATDGTGRSGLGTDPLRVDRSPRLSGKGTPQNDGTPQGHVGTPWAKRGGRGDGIEDRDDENNDENQNNVTLDARWVTMYGFDHHNVGDVLLEFQKDGDIERHVMPQGDGSHSNYCHVRFANAQSAKRAMRRNGKFAGGVMVGVKSLDEKARNELSTSDSLSYNSGKETSTTPCGTRIVRPVNGRTPSSRAHSWRPQKTNGVALQPKRAFWENVKEFIFGL